MGGPWLESPILRSSSTWHFGGIVLAVPFSDGVPSYGLLPALILGELRGPSGSHQQGHWKEEEAVVKRLAGGFCPTRTGVNSGVTLLGDLRAGSLPSYQFTVFCCTLGAPSVSAFSMEVLSLVPTCTRPSVRAVWEGHTVLSHQVDFVNLTLLVTSLSGSPPIAKEGICVPFTDQIGGTHRAI